MQRPEPKKHDECSQCLKCAPLLMPVAMAPGFPVFVWMLLCLRCRLNTRSDDYCLLASDMLHSQYEPARAAYPEWMAAEI